MTRLAVQPIAAATAVPLRGEILRAGRPRASAVFDGDDLPNSCHLGVYRGETLVGVASLYHRPPPNQSDPGAWQLRGMAIAAAARRQGCGTALLRACLSHVAARGGTRLWCNARADAAAFYRACGFAGDGAEFDVPGVGPHFRLARAVTPADLQPC